MEATALHDASHGDMLTMLLLNFSTCFSPSMGVYYETTGFMHVISSNLAGIDYGLLGGMILQATLNEPSLQSVQTVPYMDFTSFLPTVGGRQIIITTALHFGP